MTATLVYRYGLLAPTTGAEKVRTILETAHDYHNDLIAVERGRRSALRAIGIEYDEIKGRSTPWKSRL